MRAPIDARAFAAGSPLAPRREAPAGSEIERVQSSFGSSKWITYVFAVVVAGSLVAADSWEDAVCAIVVGVAALFPLALWARRVVLGLPLMPVFGLACMVYYGLPFVAGHPAIREYTFEEKIGAAVTVAGVLVVMTLLWARLSRPTAPRITLVRTLIARRGAVGVLLFCLCAAIAFQSSLIVDLGLVSPDMAAYGVLRALLLTMGMIAMLSLAYLAGAGSLVGLWRLLFIALAVTFVFYHMMSLYLVSAVQVAMAGLFGFFLGSGRVPVKLLAALVVLLTIMQAGKADIRTKYWEESAVASPAAMIADWIGTGLANLTSGSTAAGPEAIPLLQRTSLIHMLLLTQTQAPATHPYLEGSSYSSIPLLAVPRILWPERPNVTSTLIELNQHYGLLTAEAAETTSIGWGMIAEAYANFGILGCLGFALFMGTFLGFAQKFTGRVTVLSARGMAGLLIMASLVTMEASAAQYVTTIAQSLVGVWLLAVTTMGRRPVVA